MSTTKPRLRLPLLSRHSLIVGTMLLSTFMASIEGTVVTTAMPTIVDRLGDLDLFPWVFGAYLLTQAVSTPVYGRLADTFGRRGVFVASTATFLVGSMLCGFAWSMGSLILFRSLQGLGGGGLVPIALTVIADVSEPADRPRMLGYVSAVWGVSAVIGPLLGTVLVSGPGWPFVFWINAPIGVVTILMVVMFLDDPIIAGRRLVVDWWGAWALLVGLGSLMIMLVQSSTLSLTTLLALASSGVSALAVFLWREVRGDTPMFAGYLLRRPVILVAILSASMCGALLLGITGFLPVWVERVAHRSSSAGGALVGILTLSWTLANLAVGRVMRRFSYRSLALGASFVLVAGCGGLMCVGPDSQLWLMVGIAALIGVGLGVNTLVFTVSTQSSVRVQERGRATALFFFSRVSGQALGAALFGSMLDSVLPRGASPAAGVLVHGLPTAGLGSGSGLLAIGFERVFVLATAIALGMLLASACVPSADRLPIAA